MVFLKSNVYTYPGYGGKNDIRLSISDYIDMLYNLDSHNFTKAYSLKFKKATACNAYFGAASLLSPTIVSFLLAKWSTGPFYQGINKNKAIIPIATIIFFWDFTRRMYKEKPRRLYTELLTDEGKDGSYL